MTILTRPLTRVALAALCGLALIAFVPLSAGAGPRHKPYQPHLRTNIEIEGGSAYSPGAVGAPLYVQGTVTSVPPRTFCRGARTVTLYALSGGSSYVVGTSTTYVDNTKPGGLVSGFWRVDFAQPPGSFSIYATVTRKSNRHLFCKFGTSEYVNYP